MQMSWPHNHESWSELTLSLRIAELGCLAVTALES